LRTIREVRKIVRAVKLPVNVVTGWLDPDITLSQLSEAGAKRISGGGALARRAFAAFVEASRAMRDDGSFAWMREMIGMAEARNLLETSPQ
jgi:2-methylisocitrate lyase-like PEP mutase family enzyme